MLMKLTDAGTTKPVPELGAVTVPAAALPIDAIAKVATEAPVRRLEIHFFKIMKSPRVALVA